MKIAVITGASSGLGGEFYKSVITLYPELDEIWLIARRKERLDTLAAAFPGVRTRSLSMDLTDPKSFSEIESILAQEKPEIRILINNAGFGSLGNVAELDYSLQNRQIDLNAKALTAISCLSLRYMKKGSYIVNVCSIAAFAPNPRLTVYSATKAYVLSFSKGLRYELKPRGINVLAVCPGPMRTEFLSVAGITDQNSKTFATLPYCNPARVARTALKKAEAGCAVYTPRFFFKFYRVLAKLLPHNWIMPVSKA